MGENELSTLMLSKVIVVQPANGQNVS